MILGASRYYLRTIEAARRIGCEVLVTDRNPSADGFDVADYHEVADISDIASSLEVACNYDVDGVMAVNDFGVRTAAAIAHELSLPGISEEAARLATDKSLMKEAWVLHEVPTAPYKVVSSVSEAKAVAGDLGGVPLIVKPAESRGGGSRGVSRVGRLAKLGDAVKFAQSFYEDSRVIVEKYLEGPEHSVETITHEGHTHVLAVSDKVKSPFPYRVDQKVIYPSCVNGRSLERIHEVVIEAVRSLGVTLGAAHVELCSTENGPMVFELGARCGGGGTPDPIIPFVTGVKMVEEVARIAVGQTPVRLDPCVQRGCVYHFLTPPPGRVKRVEKVEEIRQWPNILDCEFLVRSGDEIREVRTGADRAGFVIAGGETRDDALDLGSRAEEAIEIEYCDGNADG